MESIRVIAESAKAAGIKVNTEFPDYAALVDARNKGDFDLVINNEKQLSNSPWEYYDYMFRLPVQDTQSTANFGRYENKKAWDLVQQLDKTPVDDTGGHEEDHLAAPEDPAHRPAGDPALVQRPVGAGQQHRLDQLAVGQAGRQPLPARRPGVTTARLGSILMLTELQPAKQ